MERLYRFIESINNTLWPRTPGRYLNLPNPNPDPKGKPPVSPYGT